MKVGILVTGVLRNYQRVLTNFMWPEEVEPEYHLITWDKTQTSFMKDDVLVPAWRNIEEAASLLPFESITIGNIKLADSGKHPWNCQNPRRMLELWTLALNVARNSDAEFFVLTRPDVALIPNELLLFNMHPQEGINISAHQYNKPFLWAQDSVFSFSRKAIDEVGKLIERMRASIATITDKDGPWDIHVRMGEALNHVRVPITVKIDHAFKYFPVRRPTPSGKFTEESLRLEKAYSEWFFQNEVGK